MTKKKLGGLGKLSQFSGIKPQSQSSEFKVRNSELEEKENNYELRAPSGGTKSTPNSELRTPNSELKKKLVTVNVKITKAQKDWLAATASMVRDNNLEPVPPSLRVYPQHLIGVAIDLLQAAEVDWTQVKNVEDLREQLNI